MKRIFILITLVGASFASVAEDYDPKDSIPSEKKKRSNLRLTARLHSLGQFSYGGRIVSGNPAMDFNLNYDRRTWGIQIFKAVDLKDYRTPINFTLAVLNKNFHLTRRLNFTPSVGFILEQSNSLADHGSDLAVIFTTTYKISKSLSLEHSSLFGNLVIAPQERDWVNRFRVLYSHGHVDLTAAYWHNNSVFDAVEYATCGVSAFYNRVAVSDRLKLGAGISAFHMPYSNHHEEVPIRNGWVVTLVAVLD